MSNISDKFHNALQSIGPGTYFLIALIFAIAVFFPGLSARELREGDETRVAGIGSETAIYDNWVEPKLNGTPFLEKPPLYFWADALSIKFFGRNPLGARFPSAVAAAMGVLAVFMLVRIMGYSSFAALLSLVVLASSAQYWNNGRKCMIDIMLAAFIIFAMAAFFALCKTQIIRKKIFWYLIFALSLGGAIFTKGLVGLAIPSSALFFWLLIKMLWTEEFKDFLSLIFRRGSKSNQEPPKIKIFKILSISSWIYLFSAAVLCFIPVAIWLYFLYQSCGYDALKTVVWTNNIGRFTGGHAEHVEPFYYYFGKLGEQLQPWTFLLPFAIIWHLIQAYREKNKNSLFMLCWLFIPYLLLIISAGKRQVYILPLYAAEAIMIGSYVAMIIEGKIKLFHRISLSLILKITAIILSIAFIITPFVFSGIALHYEQPAFAFGAPVLLFLCGIAAIHEMVKKRIGYASIALLAGFAAVLISVDTAVRGSMSHRYSYTEIFDFYKAQEQEGKTLCLYKPEEGLRGAAVYYLGKTVPQINSKELEAQRQNLNSSQIFLSIDEGVHSLEKVKIIKVFKVKRTKFAFFTVSQK